MKKYWVGRYKGAFLVSLDFSWSPFQWNQSEKNDGKIWLFLTSASKRESHLVTTSSTLTVPFSCLDYLGVGLGDSFFLFLFSHPLVSSLSTMLRSLSSPRGQRYSIPLDRLLHISGEKGKERRKKKNPGKKKTARRLSAWTKLIS
jgi:hypothetical protein